MHLSRLVGRRIKETPKDAQLVSHQFFLRGGYGRQVASGIYSLLPLATRVIRKIEAIIRDEMNGIDGQEVIMPVVMPREMWEESGRYSVIGKEMARFHDRNGKDLVLGMTHEEAVVTLARTEASSYKNFPFTLYQIQTKFRDEPRPRGGLVRVREFTMKDAYSFHTNLPDLEHYYERCFKAYERIFRRAGLKNFASFKSDTGMMGGSVAHEFMLISDAGEDSLVVCKACNYAANNEVALSKIPTASKISAQAPLTKIHTPSVATIEALCSLMSVSPDQTAKAVFFRWDAPPPEVGKPKTPPRLVFALIRGDRQINEVKLAKAAGFAPLVFANDYDIKTLGAVPGYASPVGLGPLLTEKGCAVIVDPSIVESHNLVTGANEVDQHFTGFDPSRDLPAGCKTADISMVQDADGCPQCGKPLLLTRGIEIGNIFQLGNKYSESMGMRYLDVHGKSQTPIMGCYGIGVGRLMASVIEDSHDQYGPIWPISIAPFEAQINVLQWSSPGIKETAEKLYKELQAAGVDVLLDDTDNKPGFQFADADLIGSPLRLVVAPKGLERGAIEWKLRDGTAKGDWPLAEAGAKALAMIVELRQQLQNYTDNGKGT